MTERLYYLDSYLKAFSAKVVDSTDDGLTVYLDRTAFYPTSGGQPFDTGAIGGAAVHEVVDEGDRIAHWVNTPVVMGEAACTIDWARRFDHMQQHSGQHLLSAIFEERFGLKTVSFHLGAESSTIDLETPALDAAVVLEAERRANQVVAENLPLTVTFEAAAEAGGLRKPSEREGPLRIVSIEGLDRSACGGTHVRATGEIGVVLLRKLEKVRRTVRLEFLCGARAVARARADYEALNRIAQTFSAPLDEVPALVAAELETARAGAKTRRKLEADLAQYRGRDLYQSCAPAPDGLRRWVERAQRGSLEELRPLAQSFTDLPQAAFLAAIAEPPSLLLAVSADAGMDAGKLLKALLAEAGGRGGGTPRMAQGSLPNAAALEELMRKFNFTS